MARVQNSRMRVSSRLPLPLRERAGVRGVFRVGIVTKEVFFSLLSMV